MIWITYLLLQTDSFQTKICTNTSTKYTFLHPALAGMPHWSHADMPPTHPPKMHATSSWLAYTP